MADQTRQEVRASILADPALRDYKLKGGLETFANRSFWPNFFSRLVARLNWDPKAVDLTSDGRAWPDLPDERRHRLLTLLAGFCVGEGAVSEQIAPFADAARQAKLASQESLMAWVFFLQRRDEERHARFFDRIAAEVLGLPGSTPAERRAAAREHAPAGLIELFDVRLPAVAAELAAGNKSLAEGISLYHMLLEGVVFDAGQYALLHDLADGALPGIREGIGRVQADERWHVGFGLRTFIETQPSQELIDSLVARADEASRVWGDVVPEAIRERSASMVSHRMHVSGLRETRPAA
jgi:ribonucleoside-diphosphate reductase beta chain